LREERLAVYVPKVTCRVVLGTQTVIIAVGGEVVHIGIVVHRVSAPEVWGAAYSVMLVLVVIEGLADSRDGVLTLDGALRGGLTLRQVRHRIRVGRWVRLYLGVYLVVGARLISRPVRGRRWRGRVRVPWRAG
jgi:hypothetical protein